MKVLKLLKGRKWLIWLLAAAATVFVCYLCYQYQKGGRYRDREFDKGSRVAVTVDKPEDTERMLKLCKVWGLVKYYHPKSAAGDYNMDYELFRLIGPVMEAGDQAAVDRLLKQWIDGLGKFKKTTRPVSDEVFLHASLDWISDREYLSEDLSSLLNGLTNTYLIMPDRSYIHFSEYGVPTFKEDAYPDMDYADQGYRMLALFRFWNLVEYYYPYKDIMEEDWDQVFRDFLPKFAEGSDERSYKEACAELTTRIHDSHSFCEDSAQVLTAGARIAPFSYTHTGGMVVVTQADDDYPVPADGQMVMAGDIVRKVNGVDIDEVIEEKARFKSRSRNTVILHDLYDRIFAGDAESMELTVQRGEEILTLTVPCIVRQDTDPGAITSISHRLLDGNIGYMNPNSFKRDELFEIMDEFAGTDGLILDLRAYPRDTITYSLAEYLLPHSQVFSILSKANPAVPGEFIKMDDFQAGKENPDYYKGRVAILMDERSLSMTEFTIMALRLAPQAKVIGTRSIGADGNVAFITLPGGVTTLFTSLGVYTPERGQTQRIGLEPDIYLEPSIQGITEQRDELVERAVEYIKTGN